MKPPISPLINNVDDDELEAEVKISEHERKLKELDEQMKKISEIEEPIKDEDDCQPCEPERLRKMPIIN